MRLPRKHHHPSRGFKMTTYRVTNKAEVDHQKAMEKAFDALTRGMENWKMPIKAKVHGVMFDLFNEACLFYTGSTLTITKKYADGTVDVKADGYYIAIGA